MSAVKQYEQELLFISSGLLTLILTDMYVQN